MAIKSLNPYLMFNGDAEKAIRAYENTLGARTEGLSRFGDTPGAMTLPEQKDRVMHALLHIGEGAVMVSHLSGGRGTISRDHRQPGRP